MSEQTQPKAVYYGIILAILATIIWSGNFIVARGVIHQIPPFSLAFYRWLTATLIMLPLGLRKFQAEKVVVLKHWKYFFWVALSGITLFNTLIYIAGHYSPAINLALIGTTSSPVFAVLLGAIFLKEKIRPLRIMGMAVCIAGIIILLSGGSIARLVKFHFSTGDLWVLAAAMSFAIYNTLVRKKPSQISAINFLLVIFSFGTLLLLPFYLWETIAHGGISWNWNLAFIVLYLGAGASVISYLLWNAAIARLGSPRTALFGNLIPLFATLEAMWILNEKISAVHIVSGSLVIIGLIIANLRKSS